MHFWKSDDQNGRKSFDLGDLETLFVESGVIDVKKFNTYLANIDKKDVGK